jgi:hypothetical protein
MLALTGSLLYSDVAAAQNRQKKASRMVEQFNLGSPETGEVIPDLYGYDDNGKEINLKETMQGQYTVIVFGCLT